MSTPSLRTPGHFTTDRPVAVLVVFLAAVVFGYFSLQRLPVALMPELTYPTLTIRTEYPGTAPQEVENEVSRPVEERLGVVTGLREISSVSRPGISDVILEFTWGTDMDDATQEVLERLDLVTLPNEAERPLLLRFDPSLDPIMELSFSGTGSRFTGEVGLRRLRRIADLQIKRQLEPIKGVAAVRVRGGLEEEIQVLLDSERLAQTGVSVDEVMNRLRQENINVAGGLINEGRAEFMIRAVNEYIDLDQIGETVVRRQGLQEIRVRDLGTVSRSHKELEIVTRVDGGESVQIDIFKEADANIVEVAKEVKRRLGEIEESDGADGPKMGRGPPGFGGKKGLAQRLFDEEGARLQVVADRSRFIQSSIREVRDTALMGGGLAVIALFLFLRDFRSTAIVALSIPISILVTFAPLNLTDVSLNIMSLGGLALGVGMLVDSSIVVLESIFRCRQEGDDPRAAAIRGAREVRAAVIASTLTSVAVFFPMVFVEGIAGQAFSDLGLAVVTSLLASMVVAVYFIPMLASRQGLRPRSQTVGRLLSWKFSSMETFGRAIRWMGRSWRWVVFPYFLLRLVLSFLGEALGKLLALGVFSLARLIGGLARLFLALTRRLGTLGGRRDRADQGPGWYAKALGWCLGQGGVVIVLVGLTFWATWTLANRLDAELLPEVYQGEFTVEAALPIGTPIERTQEVFGDIERAILQDRESIDSVIVTYGYDAANLQRSDEGEHSSRFKVLVTPARDMRARELEVANRLRARFEDLPGVEARIQRPVLFSAKTPIEVEIQGDDIDRLRAYSDRATETLRALPELSDVEPTLRPGAPEAQVIYDREQMARFGLNVNSVASQIRAMVQGAEATKFNLKDRRIPIVVRLQEEDRRHVEDIENLLLASSGPQPINVRAVARVEMGEGPSEIRRIDGRRVAVIAANIGSGSLSDGVDAITRALNEDIQWPATMRYQVTGQNQEWKRSEASLMLALGLSVFLVYVIMAAQFESLAQPLIIMFTIPLAFFGAFLGLYWFSTPLSIVVFLGMIMLAGIVVNNAIVLVDYANQLVRRGMDLKQAVVTAGSVRLRPIIMTTLTTMLGLAPMAFGLGEGAEIRAPMALTVIFGIAASTALTLFIIPTIYYMVARWNCAWFVTANDPLGGMDEDYETQSSH